jgi:hypothetical protein
MAIRIYIITATWLKCKELNGFTKVFRYQTILTKHPEIVTRGGPNTYIQHCNHHRSISRIVSIPTKLAFVFSSQPFIVLGGFSRDLFDWFVRWVFSATSVAMSDNVPPTFIGFWVQRKHIDQVIDTSRPMCIDKGPRPPQAHGTTYTEITWLHLRSFILVGFIILLGSSLWDANKKTKRNCSRPEETDHG